jgi:hypothetical protein
MLTTVVAPPPAKRRSKSVSKPDAQPLPQSAPTGTPARRNFFPLLREAVPALVFLVLLLALSLSSLRQKGATADEVAHLPAGYTYLAYGDFRLNPEHPPLIKLLSGIPLLFLQPKVDTSDPTWSQKDPQYGWDVNQWAFGRKFLFEWNDGDHLLFWGRAPIVLLSFLLGLGVYLCARELYGWKAGCVALALYLFTPDLLAHGQLVTTDLGLACFLFIGVYTFYRALCRLTAGNILLAGLTVGLALVVKFSGVLIFPMLVLVSAAFVFSRTPVTVLPAKTGAARRIISSRLGKAAAAAILIAVVAFVGFAVIWGCYGFRHRISPDPQISQTLNWEGYDTHTKPGLALNLIQFARNWRLVPEAYAYGFTYVLRFSEGRFAFALGRSSQAGFWDYFVVTFLVKTAILNMSFIRVATGKEKRCGGTSFPSKEK